MNFKSLCCAWLLLGAAVAPAATLNVTEHGARPDDAADDTAAINQACAKAQAGDTVLIPKGTYLISGAITPQSGVKLLGEGPEATILQGAGTAGHVMISLQKAEDVEVASLALDGANNPAVGQGITAANSKNLNLHHLAIRNLVKSKSFGPHGIYFTKAVTDSLIAHCRIENIGLESQWGSGLRMMFGSSRNKVLDNTIAHTGRGGIFAANGSTDLVIQRNTVTGSGGTGLGIEVCGKCDRALVEDNSIDHWLSDGSSSGSAFRRNVVSDKSGVFKHCGLELVNATEVVFTDNTVDGGADVGLSVSNKKPKEYIYWARNTVRGCGTWAVQLQGETGGAAYHYFYQNQYLATPKGHPRARYKDSGHGFRFNGNARSIVLDGDAIAGNGGAAIQFCGQGLERLSFRNLKITDNQGPVFIGKPAAELEWEHNEVRGNGRGEQLKTTAGFAGSEPQAALEAPTFVGVGQPVSFKNRSTAPGGEIKHVLWDFGAGLPTSEPNPTFTYDKPGTYRVTLLAWDQAGNASRAEHGIEAQ